MSNSIQIFRKWEIFWVEMDPVKGSEIAKTRPCLIVSPDSANKILSTVIVAPLTSARKKYPTRLFTFHKGKASAIAFDQMRAVDKLRIVSRDGILDKSLRITASQILDIMFSDK